MRGKEPHRHGRRLQSRITPAYAGKSCPFLRRTSPRRDHPRVCGEKTLHDLAHLCAQGSPPRVRGKASLLAPLRRAARITPACAGKSVTYTWAVGVREDHPRVCGEKEAGALSEVYETGSPPRVRGKDIKPAVREFNQGITPACAGKSTSASLRISWSRDHPRVCGEKFCQNKSTITSRGSPPRVRGKD